MYCENPKGLFRKMTDTDILLTLSEIVDCNIWKNFLLQNFTVLNSVYSCADWGGGGGVLRGSELDWII